jgi:hypothetical protein
MDHRYATLFAFVTPMLSETQIYPRRVVIAVAHALLHGSAILDPLLGRRRLRVNENVNRITSSAGNFFMILTSHVYRVP